MNKTGIMNKMNKIGFAIAAIVLCAQNPALAAQSPDAQKAQEHWACFKTTSQIPLPAGNGGGGLMPKVMINRISPELAKQLSGAQDPGQLQGGQVVVNNSNGGLKMVVVECIDTTGLSPEQLESVRSLEGEVSAPKPPRQFHTPGHP